MSVISLKNKSKSGNLTAPGDVDPGAFIPIATTTLSTATATISFTGIPQNYEHLQIRYIARGSRAAGLDQVKIQFNSDTGGNYIDHVIYGNGSSVGAYTDGASSAFMYSPTFAGNSANANVFGIGVIDILDYTSTVKNKTLRMLGGVDDNGAGWSFFGSGLWMNSASPISSITLTEAYGLNIMANSSFALYGIKRAGA